MQNITRKHKQTILYLSQGYPCPAVSGGKIKTLHTLLALAKRYRVYAVFISDTIPSASETAKLTRHGIKVKVLYSPTINDSVKTHPIGLLSHYIRGIPHYVFQYTHVPAMSEIQNIIETIEPDIIHVDHLNLAQYLPRCKNEHWVLEHHNVESYLFWTRFRHTDKFSRKVFICAEMVLTYIYEYRVLRRFDHIFAISEPERRRIVRLFGYTNCSVQPMIYPPAPVTLVKHAHPRITFVGTLGWPPNEDAIQWFLRDIFPQVRNHVHDVEFHVVGVLGQTPINGEGVVVHGFQNNLKTFLERTDVFVLPFRMGGGMRLKALTALSAGIPLVTTPLGVEGLGVRSNSECLIASNPAEFGRGIERILSSVSLRKRLHQKSLMYVALHHNKDNNEVFLREYARFTR